MTDKSDETEDLFEEFKDFLTQKRASIAEAAEADDEEVEIWDEKGRGARVRRSRAKPFLQSFGIDLDPKTGDGNADGNPDSDKGGSKGKPTAKPAQASTVRKYFAKPK
jgi:hypothetical protein